MGACTSFFTVEKFFFGKVVNEIIREFQEKEKRA
jgi:hypothetical protein